MDGYELHISVLKTPAQTAPGLVQATVDLGEIHQACQRRCENCQNRRRKVAARLVS